MIKQPEPKSAKPAATHKAARPAAGDASVIHLSAADQRTVVRAILNPPPPGASLRRAALMYRRHINSSS